MPWTLLRNAVQDVLWANTGGVSIPKQSRRGIARAIGLNDLVRDAERFTMLLDMLWVLDDDPIGAIFDDRRSLRARIDQHVRRNSDWAAEDLFKELGAFDASDKRFVLFLKGPRLCVHRAGRRRLVTVFDAVDLHLESIG